jgi:hypothetical protein
MAKIAFQWEDCWAYYPYAQPETQRDIEDALKSTLVTVSPSAQIKALEAAPVTIIEAHAHLLHDIAKKKLGITEVKAKKTKTLEFDCFSLFGGKA